MANAIDPAGIIAQVMCLDPGSEVVIPCHTYREMERIRTSCYREVKKLSSAKPQLARRIDVSRKQQEGKFSVIITISPPIQAAYIRKPDGSVTPIDVTQSDPELDRICQMMTEDGATDEEIQQYREDYLKETGRGPQDGGTGAFLNPNAGDNNAD